MSRQQLYETLHIAESFGIFIRFFFSVANGLRNRDEGAAPVIIKYNVDGRFEVTGAEGSGKWMLTRHMNLRPAICVSSSMVVGCSVCPSCVSPCYMMVKKRTEA